jgi:hypothetical protein
MCGSDTLAIAVSRSSMNVASVTVTAITHGLIARWCVVGLWLDAMAVWAALVPAASLMKKETNRSHYNKVWYAVV